MSEPVTLIHSLDARYYTDPDIFKAEQKGLLARTWQYAGHMSKVRNPGDYFLFEIAGESLFCIKGKDHVVRGYYNVCQHRAHQLVSSDGNTKLLVCPYHAWTYDLEGQLSGVFQPELFPKLDKSAIHLLSGRVDTWGGFIFVNPDSSGESLTEYLGSYADYLFPNLTFNASKNRVSVWRFVPLSPNQCDHCYIFPAARKPIA